MPHEAAVKSLYNAIGDARERDVRVDLEPAWEESKVRRLLATLPGLAAWDD